VLIDFLLFSLSESVYLSSFSVSQPSPVSELNLRLTSVNSYVGLLTEGFDFYFEIPCSYAFSVIIFPMLFCLDLGGPPVTCSCVISRADLFAVFECTDLCDISFISDYGTSLTGLKG